MAFLKILQILKIPAGLDILSRFIPKERVAGLDIRDDAVRLLLLEKSGDTYAVKRAGEVSLPNGAVEHGVPVDIGVLAKALDRLFEEAGLGASNKRKAVVVVDDALVFDQPFFAPASFGNQQEYDFIYSNLQHIFPFPYRDIYLDWHSVQEVEGKRLLLVVGCMRSVIDRYREAFSLSGMRAVALEPRALALERMLELPEGYTLLFAVVPQGLLSLVFVEGKLYLRHIRKVAGKNEKEFAENFAGAVAQEARRLRDFLFSELGEKPVTLQHLPGRPSDGNAWEALQDRKEMSVEEARPAPSVSKEEFASSPDFWGAYGAAMRSHLYPGFDPQISLLPMGTEVAYQRKKRAAFFRILENLTYGLLAFVLLLMLALNLLLGSVLEGVRREVTVQRDEQLSQDLPALEAAAKEFNAGVAQLNAIQERIRSPLPAVEAVRELQGTGVSFTQVEVQNGENPKVNLRGVAENRENLIALRDRLQEDARFTSVSLPTQAFGPQRNLRFTVSFIYEPL